MDNMEAMGAPEGAEAPMDAEQGYAITINVDPQGAMTVSSGDTSEPAQTIKEALTIALSIYKANGKPDPQAEAQAGFDSAVGESDPGDHEYRG